MYKIQTYKMKREEVPECWLLTREDITNHLIDELLAEEADEEELDQLWLGS
jgi:hypothetical protein